ncbi:MAG: putative endonuclease 4 [Bryobacteraceae bacterium]|nr:putative endonuclease 4 [Bryobacteraceae bacterium]
MFELPVRIGLHVSIAGSLAAAAGRARELGAATLQIFSSSPRMWRGSSPAPSDIARFQTLRRQYGLYPLAIHANYLINLASDGPEVRRKSIASFRAECQRAAAIGADYLVLHPGSWRGQTIGSAMDTFAASLAKATENLSLENLTLLLECTAGQGSALGCRFEELAELAHRSAGSTSLGLGYCLDTCHLLAAGYDIASAEGLEETLRRAEAVLSLASVPVIHANDSKFPLGARRDRHQHIGQGYIGEAAFRRILRHPMLDGKAFLLETPVDSEESELRNLNTLRRLAATRRADGRR